MYSSFEDTKHKDVLIREKKQLRAGGSELQDLIPLAANAALTLQLWTGCHSSCENEQMPSSGAFIPNFCCCAPKVLPHGTPCAFLRSALQMGAKAQRSRKREKIECRTSILCKARLCMTLNQTALFQTCWPFQSGGLLIEKALPTW